MQIVCEDCRKVFVTYRDWVCHIVSPQHFIQVDSKLVSWITEGRRDCIVLVTLNALRLHPLDVFTKFGRHGFISNFYMHPNQSLFIIKYDDIYTAELGLAAVLRENMWNLYITRLVTLDLNYWARVFPTKHFELNSRTSSSVLASPETCGQVASATNIHQFSVHSYGNTTTYTSTNVKAVQSIEIGSCHQGLPNLLNIKYQTKPEAQSTTNLTPSSITNSSESNSGDHQTQHLPKPDIPDRKPCGSGNAQPRASSPLLNKRMTLDGQLEDFCDSVRVNLDQLAEINRTLLWNLESLLRKTFPKAELYLFDSVRLFQGQGFKSDLEINVDKLYLNSNNQDSGLNYEDIDELIYRVGTLVKNATEAPGIPSYLDVTVTRDKALSCVNFSHQSYPDIKFRLTPCILPSQIIRRRAQKLINFYSRMFPILRKLLSFILYWGYFHGFVGQFRFNDYAVSLTVLYYLAGKNVVPTLELLQSFCMSYINGQDHPNWLNYVCNDESVKNLVALQIRSQFQPEIIPLLDLAREFFKMSGDSVFLQQHVLCSFKAEFVLKSNYLTYAAATASSFKKPCDDLPTHASQLLTHGIEKEDSICVQDAFDPHYNVMSSVTPDVLLIFQEGCNHLLVLLDKFKLDPQPNLMSLFCPINNTAGEQNLNKARQKCSDSICEVSTCAVKGSDSSPELTSSSETSTSSYYCSSSDSYLANIRREVLGLPVPTCDETSSTSAEAASTLDVNAVIARFKERIHTDNNNIEFPLPYAPDGNPTIYSIFTIREEFLEAYKAELKNFPLQNYSEAEKLHMQSLSSTPYKLWEFFAMEFIRIVWSECFAMDVVETTIYEESMKDNQESNNACSTEAGSLFWGYKSYCSTLDCVGYLPRQLKPRKLMKCTWNQNRLEAAIAARQTTLEPHPFDKEAAITDMFSESMFENRDKGVETWKFQCLTMYENPTAGTQPDKVGIIFGLTGAKAQHRILDYVLPELEEMFHSYQLYSLRVWFENNKT